MKLNKNKIIILIISVIVIFIALTFIIDSSNTKHVTKSSIIDCLNKNSDKFESVIKYIEDKKSYFTFYFDNTSKSIKFIEYNNNGEESDITIDDVSVQENIKFIFEKLEFVRIDVGKDYILFIRESPGYDQGVLYSRDGSANNGFDDEKHIEGNWYYYLKTYT